MEELYARNPAVCEYPILGSVRDGNAVIQGCDPTETDSTLMLGYLLYQARDFDENHLRELLDLLADKWASKGGPKILISQIADICYEGSVYCFLVRSSLNVKLLPEEDSSPDLSLEVTFYAEEAPIRLAIECKNIRKPKDNSDDIARTIVQKISEKRSKSALWTQKGFDDYLFFIDLPATVYDSSLNDPHAYIDIAQQVMRTLWLSGIKDVDPFQIIYTHLFEEDMPGVIGKTKNFQLTILHPVQTHSVILSAARVAFLSFLLRLPHESANVENIRRHSIQAPINEGEAETINGEGGGLSLNSE